MTAITMDLEICSDCGCAVPTDIAHYDGQAHPICLLCFDRLYNTHVADIDDDDEYISAGEY